MTDPEDFKNASEVYHNSMQESLLHLDQLREELRESIEQSINERIAAKEELSRIEREAHSISQAYMDQHRKEIEQQIRKEVILQVAKKLIMAEIPSLKVKQILELSPQVLADAWMELGFDAINETHIGHVAYEGSGKSGFVIFYREDLTLRFYREFGAGHILAFITVPSPDLWEKSTGLPMEERQATLEFIAKRVLRDQAPGHLFRISDDEIIFYEVSA